MKTMSASQKGFTLLELLLAIAVLLLLTVASKELYSGYIRNNDLDSTAKTLASDLAGARNKAMAGGGDNNWGAHLVNQAAAPDYYEIFSSPADYAHASTSIKQTVYFPKTVDFGDPLSGASKDIIFARLVGTTTATSTIVSSLTSSMTISVNLNGLVY
ncbi:prepilin-type N-terminal cleavage/methylation domain-containing protein [Candidatus Falkowbacteria bacterium]|nr:prepilin-type N-terminal cleavage/methylation domain-containing protein [Candidatus Falkowbacteria bacterium]